MDNLAVIAYAKKKLSPQEIAKLTGYPLAEIEKVVEDAAERGIVRIPKPKVGDDNRLSHEDRKARRKQIAAFAKKGKTINETAEKFQVSPTAVASACREFGVSVPSDGRANSGLSQLKIIANLIDGLSERAVAEHLGVSVQYVNSVALKARKEGVFRAVDRAVDRGRKGERSAAGKIGKKKILQRPAHMR